MGKITIIGLGPGSKEHLTISAYEKLKKHKSIYLRTEKHPVVEYLREEGIKFQTFDNIYNTNESFEEVYNSIAQDLLKQAQEEDILYAVPGHPFVAENTVQLIIQGCEAYGVKTDIHPAMSFLDVMFTALEIDPVDGFRLIDGLQLDEQKPDPSINTIITQVYDPLVASELKLVLMDYYHDEKEIYVVKAAGIEELEKIVRIPLYELDRLVWMDYLTTIFVPKVENS